MRIPAIRIATIAALALAGAATAAERGPPAAGLAKLESITMGRTAGAPVDCLRQRNIQSVEIVPGTALVYTDSFGTIYVNRPKSGAAFLRANQILVTNTYSTQLCDIDVVQLVDQGSQINEGSVGLGSFIPYPKPGK